MQLHFSLSYEFNCEKLDSKSSIFLTCFSQWSQILQESICSYAVSNLSIVPHRSKLEQTMVTFSSSYCLSLEIFFLKIGFALFLQAGHRFSFLTQFLWNTVSQSKHSVRFLIGKLNFLQHGQERFVSIGDCISFLLF